MLSLISMQHCPFSIVTSFSSEGPIITFSPSGVTTNATRPSCSHSSSFTRLCFSARAGRLRGSLSQVPSPRLLPTRLPTLTHSCWRDVGQSPPVAGAPSPSLLLRGFLGALRVRSRSLPASFHSSNVVVVRWTTSMCVANAK